MTELAGKKLLILGGNPETGSLVNEANALGVHTIVVDPNPKAPAKQFAAEHYEIDGFDVVNIVELARRLDVDGVLVGVADILVKPYQEVCEQLQLPCYATQATVSAFSGKDGFKEACERFGVPDIPGLVVDGTDVARALNEISLPAMVKPVDNGGGVGMRICSRPEDIDGCVDASMHHSKTGRFLVERYMECDDMFAYYTFKDNKAYLSATADRITTKTQGELSPVCMAARYPSRHTEAFLDSMHPKLLRLFDGLGVSNGVLMLQFFVEAGSFFAYDPGFRLQGEAPHLHLKAINGFDHRHMLVNFALTGSMGVHDFDVLNDCRLDGMTATTFWVLLRGGRIQDIEGLEAIEDDPNVTAVIQRLTEGDLVEPEMLGTERQVLARIYVASETPEELAQMSEGIRRELRVLDEFGQDMVLDWVRPESLL